ncbi:Putative zinc metalloprotease Rip3 [Stieleria maiorica]|uniref:Zinc metalloprotease n=1 Tax=Stieleria maiorica TaxID=2795974 RepID=A0A5B9MFA9_9BACT|nr:site-2 protease family protein [Stieleria maiorica]QEF98294.1 Putative zinc metalloprotease Rip3 [Stieleria maiorica]
MKGSWHLGQLAGIDVRIHWTFLLLPIWIYYSSLAAGSGAVAATVAVLLVFAIFGCVVLHELGHSLTARRFGIETHDITLLPIGGVASLQRIPRSPWQELAIAVAGPAVNVVIAMVLFALLPILAATALLPVGAIAFLSKLAWVNVALVVFNMLPAFPMDGGRVLRSVLALGLPYRSATRAAAGVGQVIAILFALFGLFSGNLMLVILAGFVFLAGRGEAMMVEREAAWQAQGWRPMGDSSLEGFSADRSTDAPSSQAPSSPDRPSLPVVSAQWDARNVLGWLSNQSVDEFLVSSHGVVVAVVRKCDLLKAVAAGMGSFSLERLLAGRFMPFRNLRTPSMM